jgi:urease accessory protein
VTTRVEVGRSNGRYRLQTTSGLLRAQRLAGPPEICRVALVATTALLLGGDDVQLDVRVGRGAQLELSDIAGTVAYNGRGRAASWTVRVVVEEGATLAYSCEPFVVADGAEVTRSLRLDVAQEASASTRETLVLGRAGESGGLVRDRLLVRRGDVDVLVEEQQLNPATRARPGLLGTNRIIDTVLTVGIDPGPAPAGAIRMALVDPGCTLTRYLGQSLADSPLQAPCLS